MNQELHLQELGVIAGRAKQLVLPHGMMEVQLIEGDNVPFGTIALKYNGNETVLVDFAPDGQSNSTYNVSIPYWKSRDSEIEVFLIGTWRAVAMTVNGTFYNICDWNRWQYVDAGWWREFQVYELSESYVVIYESGIARITDSGKCLWHIKLCWDDFFVRADDTGYWFENEHENDGQPFLVSLDDGNCAFRKAHG